MEYSVLKMGAEMFDALHAYGLGILLANALQSPVELKDEGIVYTLQSSQCTFIKETADILRDMLVLPTAEELQTLSNNVGEITVPTANLDGILATVFTTSGARLVAAHDVLNKSNLDPKAIEKALSKVKKARHRWEACVKRQKFDPSETWMLTVLQDYDIGTLREPVPMKKRGGDISVPMTIDPSFSYATRRPLSDGLIADKIGITMANAPYAALLANIGAARFLRAQRVSGNYVNFYVPLAHSMLLYPDTALPILNPIAYPSDRSLILQCIDYVSTARTVNAHWKAIAYQTLQTQGVQQSISYSRGCLGVGWLNCIQQRAGRAIIGYWKWLLSRHQSEAPFEIDVLVDSLMGRQLAAWQAHLYEIAALLHNWAELDILPYSIGEVREVTNTMKNSTNTPLSTVLEREQGTLRFGRALRSLGKYNHAALRDLIEELDVVRTDEQLIWLLALAAQECEVAKAKSDFVIVPDEEDLKYLLDDIEQYGPQTVAKLLFILSAVRYPRKAEAQTTADTVAVSLNAHKGEGNDHN